MRRVISKTHGPRCAASPSKGSRAVALGAVTSVAVPFVLDMFAATMLSSSGAHVRYAYAAAT
ncbi:MAG: hypothetical protein Q9174_004943, partial [Haloplaca sp. 1 TL-2023]